MRKLFLLFFTLSFLVANGFAQHKLAGHYDQQNHYFAQTDTNIETRQVKDLLIPFMIRGKNPFDLKTNRVGFIDTTGRVVIKPLYNNCSAFNGKYAIVSIGGGYKDPQNKMGVIDRKGKVIVPVNYSSVALCQNGLFRVWKEKKMGFVDAGGKVIVPFGKYARHIAPERWGIFLEDAPPLGFSWSLLDPAPVFFKGYLAVAVGDKWGVIDSTGRETAPLTFEGIDLFKGNLAPYTSNKKQGLINGVGRICVPANYDKVEVLDDSHCIVHLGKKVGVLDTNNRVILPVELSGVAAFGNGFQVTDDHYYHLLYDSQGKLLAKAASANVDLPTVWSDDSEKLYFAYNSVEKKIVRYQEIRDCVFRNGHTTVNRYFYEKDDLWGLLGDHGTEITPPIYDDFECGALASNDEYGALIGVSKDQKYGIIDRTGKIIMPFLYDKFIPDWEGFYAKQNGKYGLFLTSFKPKLSLRQLIPAIYDTITVRETLGIYQQTKQTQYFRVSAGGKWGLLNYNGEMMIAPKYNDILGKATQFVIVKSADKWGLVNNHDKPLLDCTYDAIGPYVDTQLAYDGEVILKKDGKFGIANASGKLIAAPSYDNIRPYFDKYWVKKNGRLGMINARTGRVIAPCEYDFLNLFNYDGNQTWDGFRSPYVFAGKRGQMGLIDTLGNIKLPVIYDHVWYSRGEYQISLHGQQGVLDKNLNVIVPPKYFHVSRVESKGLYVIQSLDYGVGIINSQGQIVAEPIYQQCIPCGNLIIIKKDGKFGTMDLEGKMVDEIIYSNIVCMSDKIYKTP